jgi:hypothetical protein
MTMPRLAPTPAELKKYLDLGYTHKEIAKATGLPRGTISSAIQRAGLSQDKMRYSEEIPWRVREEHATHYAARMLRLLGRRRAGIELSQAQGKALDSWLRRLREMHAVVTYEPASEDGFYYVDGDPLPGGIPIHPPKR